MAIDQLLKNDRFLTSPVPSHFLNSLLRKSCWRETRCGIYKYYRTIRYCLTISAAIIVFATLFNLPPKPAEAASRTQNTSKKSGAIKTNAADSNTPSPLITTQSLPSSDPESFGITDPADLQIDNGIWNGSRYPSIIELLQRLPPSLRSQNLHAVMHRLLVRSAPLPKPPKGIKTVDSVDGISPFALRTLALYRVGNQSGSLALLGLLPEMALKRSSLDQIMVEQQLLTNRDDGLAVCNRYWRNFSNYESLFWQEIKFYCQTMGFNGGLNGDKASTSEKNGTSENNDTSNSNSSDGKNRRQAASNQSIIQPSSADSPIVETDDVKPNLPPLNPALRPKLNPDPIAGLASQVINATELVPDASANPAAPDKALDESNPVFNAVDSLQPLKSLDPLFAQLMQPLVAQWSLQSQQQAKLESDKKTATSQSDQSQPSGESVKSGQSGQSGQLEPSVPLSPSQPTVTPLKSLRTGKPLVTLAAAPFKESNWSGVHLWLVRVLRVPITKEMIDSLPLPLLANLIRSHDQYNLSPQLQLYSYEMALQFNLVNPAELSMAYSLAPSRMDNRPSAKAIQAIEEPWQRAEQYQNIRSSLDQYEKATMIAGALVQARLRPSLYGMVAKLYSPMVTMIEPNPQLAPVAGEFATALLAVGNGKDAQRWLALAQNSKLRRGDGASDSDLDERLWLLATLNGIKTPLPMPDNAFAARPWLKSYAIALLDSLELPIDPRLWQNPPQFTASAAPLVQSPIDATRLIAAARQGRKGEAILLTIIIAASLEPARNQTSHQTSHQTGHLDSGTNLGVNTAGNPEPPSLLQRSQISVAAIVSSLYRLGLEDEARAYSCEVLIGAGL